PPPIVSSTMIINLLWPAVGNALAEIRLALPGKCRQMSLYCRCELFGVDTKCRKIIRGTNGNAPGGCIHQLEGPGYRIRHVHHGQCSTGIEKTGVGFTADSMVEDVNRIIGGAAAG